jgi:hypothetical protein
MRHAKEIDVTAYKNFVSDFPERCRELLDRFDAGSRLARREVTLLLCVATSAIAVPYERLRPRSKKWEHPFRDRERYVDAARKFKEILNSPFLGSHLWPTPVESWCHGQLRSIDGDPDAWPELLAPVALSTETMVDTVVRHLRNALSHGNIFTRRQPEIDRLVLLSKPDLNRPDYDYLIVSPSDLRAFLANWVSVLTELRIPDAVVSEFDEEAA